MLALAEAAQCMNDASFSAASAGTSAEHDPVDFASLIKRAKKKRCGECAGCTSDVDCNRCKYCLDKPKMGGNNTLRRQCINRICTNKASSALVVEDSEVSAYTQECLARALAHGEATAAPRAKEDGSPKGWQKGTREAPSIDGLPPPPIGKRAYTKSAPGRPTHTAYQKAVMTRFYEFNKMPDTEEREALGKALGLTPRAVQVWFQNRRQRLKEAKEVKDASSGGQWPSPYARTRVDLPTDPRQHAANAGPVKPPAAHAYPGAAEAPKMLGLPLVPHALHAPSPTTIKPTDAQAAAALAAAATLAAAPHSSPAAGAAQSAAFAHAAAMHASAASQYTPPPVQPQVQPLAHAGQLAAACHSIAAAASLSSPSSSSISSATISPDPRDEVKEALARAMSHAQAAASTPTITNAASAEGVHACMQAIATAAGAPQVSSSVDSGYGAVLLEAYANLPLASRAALPRHVTGLIIDAYNNMPPAPRAALPPHVVEFVDSEMRAAQMRGLGLAAAREALALQAHKLQAATARYEAALAWETASTQGIAVPTAPAHGLPAQAASPQGLTTPSAPAAPGHELTTDGLRTDAAPAAAAAAPIATPPASSTPQAPASTFPVHLIEREDSEHSESLSME